MRAGAQRTADASRVGHASAPSVATRTLLSLLAALLMLSLVGCSSKPKRSDVTVERSAPRSTHQPRRAPAPPPRENVGRYSQEHDAGPAEPRDVSGLPEPKPRREPLAKYGNKSPYTVLGRTYRVMSSGEGYKERGLASWYGTKFHGHLTSSREPYDMYQFTAAHKTLPLPSYVQVKNLDNGRSLIVRVNDRGPFHEGRIIDLSYAAAVRLGVDRTGTARVEVRAINGATADSSVRYASAPPPANAPARGSQQVAGGAGSAPRQVIAPRAPDSRVFLQIGAFGDKDNAKRLEKRLEAADIDDVFLDRERVSGRTVHRVRIGPLAYHQAEGIAARVRRLGLSTVTVSAD